MDLGERLGALRFLIRDRDPFFSAALAEVFGAEELQIITTRRTHEDAFTSVGLLSTLTSRYGEMYAA